MNKFKAKRTTIDGITYASKREGKVCNDFRLLERAGVIHSLELQPKYDLVVSGVKICSYKADARYIDSKTGRLHVVDIKSPPTAKKRDFRITMKLMKACHNVDVEVIY